MSNLTQKVGKYLNYFPSLHAATRAWKTNRLISGPPATLSTGFKIYGSEEMRDGTFEPDETLQIRELLATECGSLINVGANVGYYVCHAQNLEVPTIAIEPLSRNIAFLRKNCFINGFTGVEIYQNAAGAETDIAPIYGGGTAASLLQGWAGAVESSEMISVVRLDDLLGDRFSDQHPLILIDVEGFELEVLRGSTSLLQRKIAPIWFVEICIDEHQPDGVAINPELQSTFEIFWKHGYEAEKAGIETGIVSERDVAEWCDGVNLPATHNFIFRRTKQPRSF